MQNRVKLLLIAALTACGVMLVGCEDKDDKGTVTPSNGSAIATTLSSTTPSTQP